jgi:hypothetical protein
VNINITPEGRCTVNAKPEWFPRPDGFERAVVFQPGYNGDPNPDPRKNFGVHGMSIEWLLRGPGGVTVFRLGTGWVPGRKGVEARISDMFPMGEDLGYHWPSPHYDGQLHFSDCTHLPGGECYYDGSGLGADRVLARFITEGEPAVWAELEDYYASLLERQP